MKNRIQISAILLLSLALAACQGGDKPNIELIQDMMESPALKAQEADPGAPNNAAMRVPPENTVPVGFKPYPYGMDVDAAKQNKNPLAGDFSEPVLLAGMKSYETNCMICHAQHGEGGDKQSVSEFMALKAPTLLSDKVKNMTDGHLYHIVTMGQGVMGGYATQVPQSVRWQLVNYIRHLQKDHK